MYSIMKGNNNVAYLVTGIELGLQAVYRSKKQAAHDMRRIRKVKPKWYLKLVFRQP